MTESEYQSYKKQQLCAGYTPVHISAWSVGGQVRFAAIWKKSAFHATMHAVVSSICNWAVLCGSCTCNM
eukprot:jgi/Chrzof1/3740/Cz13g07060.t1